MLREAGVDSVNVTVNASNLELKRTIRKFELVVNQADIAVIYYAGHGIELAGSRSPTRRAARSVLRNYQACRSEKPRASVRGPRIRRLFSVAQIS
jgi:uncharacterized caspase-like protein